MLSLLDDGSADDTCVYFQCVCNTVLWLEEEVANNEMCDADLKDLLAEFIWGAQQLWRELVTHGFNANFDLAEWLRRVRSMLRRMAGGFYMGDSHLF